MSRRLVVVNYGVGNLLSVQRGLEACGAEVEIFSELDWWKRDPEDVVETCKERSLTAV